MRILKIGWVVFCMCCFMASGAAAFPPGDKPGSGDITTNDAPGVGTLSADLMTYAPGSVATLSGAGFLSGETVALQVLPRDGSPAVGAEHQPWRVAAGPNGAFVTAWPVCTDDCVGKMVRAVAVGEYSGTFADVYFTNGTVVPTEPPGQLPPQPGDKPGSGEITIDDTPGATSELRADQPAYVPGATATLRGIGFLSSEGVTLQVVHQDGTPAEGMDHWPRRIAADQNGAFTATWRVCTDDCVGKIVRAVAMGEISGRSAEVHFADGTVTPSEPPGQLPPEPGDKPGSGEITIDDSPAAVALSADQGSYVPGSQATLQGIGFVSSEPVLLEVLHLDGSPAEGLDHWPWRIAADQNGAFTTAWRVCTDDCVGKVVRAVAVGAFSGRTAEVHFADGAPAPKVASPQRTGERGVTDFALRQNGPNPFTGTTVIAFALAERSAVELRVFDVLGHEVATLASGTMDAGTHSVEWNGRGRDGGLLSPGMYFCRMDAGAFHQLRKMTLMR